MSSHVPQMRSAQLQAEGWSRRFTALGRRLNEAAELYSELGYEVRLEPIDLDEEESMEVESCKDCFVTIQARTIYTRPREAVKDSESIGIQQTNLDSRRGRFIAPIADSSGLFREFQYTGEKASYLLKE